MVVRTPEVSTSYHDAGYSHTVNYQCTLAAVGCNNNSHIGISNQAAGKGRALQLYCSVAVDSSNSVISQLLHTGTKHCLMDSLCNATAATWQC